MTALGRVARRDVLQFSIAATATFSLGGCARDATAREDGDVNVSTQYGQHLQLRKDLLRDSTWLISFIFTSCKSRCPLTGRNLAALRKQMSPSENFRIVSLTIDPAHDTPERLLRWSEPFHHPEWVLLTSDAKSTSEFATSLFGQQAEPGKHLPVALIGRGASLDHAIRASVADSPELLLNLLRRAKLGETSVTIHTP